jgi:hypothetical protein
MVSRILMTALVVAGLSFGLASNGQDAPPKADDFGKVRDDLTLKEKILNKQYQEFELQVLKLKQRLERSGKQEDRDRALILDRVLEFCKDKAISVKFEQMVETLQSKELKNLPDIKAALDRSKGIADDLRDVITMLREDSRAEALRSERMRLEQIMKELEQVIQNQKSVQGLTDNNKTQKNELKKIQHSVSEKTIQIAKKLGGKDSEAKSSKGDPKAAGKNGDKAAQAKGEGKGEGKGGEGKGKPGESKAGKDSKGQSQAKAGEPGTPNPRTPDSTNPPKNKGEKKDGPPPPPQQAKDNPPNGKKQVEEAYDRQQQAENKIEENKNEDASAEQTEALKKLEQARKELERLLRQLREEELERLLAALQARCEKMLAMQIAVLSGTEAVDKGIIVQALKEASREQKQESIRLSDREGDIVLEATKAIEILEAEGSAVAFPEVFQQVREDMKHVQRRLNIVDVGEVTQGIERDIIDSLKEMIEALKKQRSENKGSGSSSPSGPPPDPKLLDKIAELKMIRSLQIRVNTRTQTYGKMYKGEQALDPNIRRELHNLSERQERIFEVTNRMAKGENR